LNEKKTRFISIRNDALLDGDIKPRDKYLLMILENRKLFNTKDGDWFTVDIRPKKLLELSMISDKRTLFNCLKSLRELKYIDFDFTEIPRFDKMEIKIHCTIPFTLVDEEMFFRLRELDTGEKKPYVITVFYYILEHYHNPYHGGNQGVATPSRKMIYDALKTNNKRLTNLIEIMQDAKICEYRKGIFYEGYQRSRNRYLPNTIMHKKGEEFIGQNKRRYINHKKDSYFVSSYDDDEGG